MTKITYSNTFICERADAENAIRTLLRVGARGRELQAERELHKQIDAAVRAAVLAAIPGIITATLKALKDASSRSPQGCSFTVTDLRNSPAYGGPVHPGKSYLARQ